MQLAIWKESPLKVLLIAGACVGFGSSAIRANAFSLLGPFEPWMEQTNDLRHVDDIGGPMAITNGYRWNLPTLTYGFDQTFVDFFGSNGVAAVSAAIQILNDLPPASQIVLSNYPLTSLRQNFVAESQSLLDLKSYALWALLEQMGLAQPIRYIFVLKQWDPIFLTYPYAWPEGTIPNLIVQRNFDPETTAASDSVNMVFYFGHVASQPNGNFLIISPADPGAPYMSAVANITLNDGSFYTGLTYDDAGGVRYLLSATNVDYESLIPGVFSAGTNAAAFVNYAWRPGVEKITFVPHPVNTTDGSFLTITNQFVDRYFINDVLAKQQLARVISQPDILFSTADLNNQNPLGVSRTGTTHWINNSGLNGNPGGAGPGVIQPPITIGFGRAGRALFSTALTSEDSVDEYSTFWGSFDQSTNPPVIYPIPRIGSVQSNVRLWIWNTDPQTGWKRSFEWSLVGQSGAQFDFQTSTNLSLWATLFTVTNDGSVCSYVNEGPGSAVRFYRLTPH